MEEAVHEVIAGEIGLKKIAAKYAVDRDVLDTWHDAYTEAGRKALAGLGSPKK